MILLSLKRLLIPRAHLLVFLADIGSLSSLSFLLLPLDEDLLKIVKTRVDGTLLLLEFARCVFKVRTSLMEVLPSDARRHRRGAHRLVQSQSAVLPEVVCSLSVGLKHLNTQLVRSLARLTHEIFGL